MAYSAMSTQVNGYLVTATDWNQIVNNFAATGVGTVTTNGDMTYATGANALTRRAIGSTNQILMVAAGVPTWQDIPATNVIHTARSLYLTSDVNFNNTTAFGDITGLTFSIAANEVWSISLHLYVTYTSAQAFKLAVNGPAAPTAVSAQAMAISPTVSVFSAGNAAAYDTAFLSNTAIGSAAVIVGGILIRNGANAGTIAMRGAQAAAAATNTAFKAGSYIQIQRSRKMPDIGPVITVTYAQRIALNATQLVPNQFYFQTDTVGVGDGTTSRSGYYQVTGGNPNGWAYRDTYLPVQLLQTNGKVMSGYIFTNELDVALNPTSASAANSYGVRASIFTNPGLLANITGAINAGLLMAQHFAASTVSALNAVYANVTNFGNGTVLNGQALVAEVIQGGSGTISAIQGIVAQMFKTGSGAISYATGLVLYGWNNATNYVNILLGTNLQPNGAWNIYSVVTDPSVLGQANIIFGNTTSTLATNATTGFPHIPTCAGAPTGVPTLYTGVVPMVFDTTNNKLWIYTAGVWKGVVVA